MGTHAVSIKFEKWYHLDSAKNNEVSLGFMSQNSFLACFEYDSCYRIYEYGNTAKSSAGQSSLSGITGIPSGSLPFGFIYKRTSHSESRCNTVHRGLMSSMSFEGNCHNSYLKTANLNATRYGLVYKSGTIVPVHFGAGNKFYCGSHTFNGFSNHIVNNSSISTIFHSSRPASSFLSCTNYSSGQCYAMGSRGFLFHPSSGISPSSTIQLFTQYQLTEPATCPICIPMPKMASATPVIDQKSASSDCAVYPNPMSTVATVELDKIAEIALTVRIMDMTGRVLLVDTLEAGAKEYKLKGYILSAGMYQVVVTNGKDIYCTKKLRVDK